MSFLSELPMNFIRTSNENSGFLSELPMKIRGYKRVYNSIQDTKKSPFEWGFFCVCVEFSDAYKKAEVLSLLGKAYVSMRRTS